MARHIRKGDQVIVTAGNDRGATGPVLRVISGERDNQVRVVVQGVNIRAKHLKPTQTNPQSSIVRREMPIHISNVSPVVDGKPTRVRFQSKPDGSKVRIAVRGGSELHILRGPRKRTAASSGSAPGAPGTPRATRAAGAAGAAVAPVAKRTRTKRPAAR